MDADHQIANYSGDHETTFQVTAMAKPEHLRNWSLTCTGVDVRVGAIHAWIVDSEMGRFTSGHTRSHLVGMPGTAYSAITVGSYATRNGWDSEESTITLSAINMEDISYFSSPGPTRDGDTKPEITAPGQWIIAPLSADAPVSEIPQRMRVKDVDYAAMQGTSMAAPFVTGAIALLLEKAPTLDWAEAKRRLIKSARQDSFTAPCWNCLWGYGKMDIKKLLEVEPK